MCYAFNAGIFYTHIFYANISHSFLKPKVLYEYYDFICATDYGQTLYNDIANILAGIRSRESIKSRLPIMLFSSKIK